MRQVGILEVCATECPVAYTLQRLGEIYLLQCRATIEEFVLKGDEVLGQHHALQACATSEQSRMNYQQVLGEGHLLQSCTSFESIRTNINAVRYHNFFQIHATVKGTNTDSLQSFRQADAFEVVFLKSMAAYGSKC